jgi:hypothetical protein
MEYGVWSVGGKKLRSDAAAVRPFPSSPLFHRRKAVGSRETDNGLFPFGKAENVLPATHASSLERSKGCDQPATEGCALLVNPLPPSKDAPTPRHSTHR